MPPEIVGPWADTAHDLLARLRDREIPAVASMDPRSLYLPCLKAIKGDEADVPKCLAGSIDAVRTRYGRAGMSPLDQMLLSTLNDDPANWHAGYTGVPFTAYTNPLPCTQVSQLFAESKTVAGQTPEDFIESLLSKFGL